MMTDQAYYDRVTEARNRVQPVTYVCYRAAETIIVDGRLEAPSWKRAEWTNLFGHIEEPHIIPEWATGAKMLWDDHFFMWPSIWNVPMSGPRLPHEMNMSMHTIRISKCLSIRTVMASIIWSSE